MSDEVVSSKAKKPKGNIANLIPANMRSKEEHREIARNGGIKSGEARRKNKTFKEAMNWYLEMQAQPTTDRKAALLEKFPDLTNRDALAIAAVEAAEEDKDVRAMVFVRDTSGEVPKTQVSLEQEKPFEITIKTID